MQVFDHGFTAARLAKNISDESNSLFMGFPECGSSYLLLMQLDEEFKPCPKLIEAQIDSSGKGEAFGDINKVIRVKDLDVSRMPMCKDEISLSLLDRQTMVSILDDVNVNEVSGQGLPSNSGLRGSIVRSSLPITFSSIVDGVFELEKGSTGHASSTSDLTSQAVKKLTASNSDQDLTASGGFGSYGIMDEDPLTVAGLPSARLLSPPQLTGPSVSAVSMNYNEPKSMPAGTISGNFAVSGSNSRVAFSMCKRLSLLFLTAFTSLNWINNLIFSFNHIFHTCLFFLSFITWSCCSRELKSS